MTHRIKGGEATGHWELILTRFGGSTVSSRIIENKLGAGGGCDRREGDATCVPGTQRSK